MNASRTIELGRAVIAMQSANIELWLTTLITLSPDTNNPAAQNASINLQTLDTDTLLNYLSSGNVWVKRGNGMHMSFNCTQLGRPLDSRDLRQLGDCIVNAPAWKQLGLCLCLPLSYEPTHGQLHVNIDRWREDAQSPTNAEGGIESSPRIYVRTPDAIPVLDLNSIEFVMAFCETRTRTTARKRPKQEMAKSASEFRDVEAFSADRIPNSQSLCRPDPLLDSACQSSVGDQGLTTHVQARLCMTPSNPNPEQKLGFPNRGKRRALETSSELAVIEVTDELLSESARIAALADAGLRFSICLNLRGSLTNLKTKANTFTHGLANVAPAFWRAGYTSACAHVMYTAPTLARSLDRLSLSASSQSLRRKIAQLKKSPSEVNLEQGLGGCDLVGDAVSTIADRLWCHVQRTQLSRTASSSVKTLCDPRYQAKTAETAEEILEEYRGLGTSVNHENGEHVHGLIHDPPVTMHSCTQGYLNSDLIIDIMDSSTTKSQNGKSICPTSNSVDRDSASSISQTCDKGVAESGEIYLGCNGSVDQSLLNNIRTACEDISADAPLANELFTLRTDDEHMLFSL